MTSCKKEAVETSHYYISDRELMSSYTKILVVDDNKEFSKLVFNIIKKSICNSLIDTAYSGKKAVEALIDEEYDLIILDINLPEIDGFKVAEISRVVNIFKTKIVYVSANKNFKNQFESEKRDDGSLFFSKPIDINEFKNTLLNIVEG